MSNVRFSKPFMIDFQNSANKIELAQYIGIDKEYFE